jgi:hypothetical protein
MNHCGDCMSTIDGALLSDFGKCRVCHGTGANIHLNADTPKCEYCHGTGVCPTCGGTGSERSGPLIQTLFGGDPR